MALSFYNTLSGRKKQFTSIEQGRVSMYHCGPTVYARQHLGNLSMFVFTDLLRRTIEYFGYQVNQVINFTDFGHLSSENDQGEDKMSKGLKAEGLDFTMENMKLLGRKYADIFLDDLAKLNIDLTGTQLPFASDFVEEQKALIERLEEKGFIYRTSDGLYFDTAKFPNYGELGTVRQGGESRISANSEKRDQKDFVLWKFSTDLGWPSKWGKGFPGWHIECSAMIFKILGEQIDIHTGGIEHIGVHHNNEIAQSEAASGKSPFARFWLHREHIKIADEKISKSVGNVLYISELIERGIHPLSFRYWLLTGSYRTPMNFTWEAVQSAQHAFQKIIFEFGEWSEEPDESGLLNEFEEAISDDLNSPIAISLLQQSKNKETVRKMDKVFGLDIEKLSQISREIPQDIIDMQNERDLARIHKDFAKSDSLRRSIEERGYIVEDRAQKTLIFRPISTISNSPLTS